VPTATDGIWDYIAEDSIDEADQWIGKLFDAFDAIGNTPGIGHKREDLTDHPVLFPARRSLPRYLSRHIAACRNCGCDSGRTRYSRFSALPVFSVTHSGKL
jgi:plasmid stabilization system protein ParE